ncbi:MULTISPECIES: cupin domain-containing protein [Pandoraea]|uniref:cupin domain-containing protein n=1 Tax=Pandoraea TaxID=93217 RepID=UPI001F5D5BB5|nr:MULTISPECIES: cupin domain-containing protein [Pandoraea]MCI3207973.1 anti-sigma factor [Pandoraea sp. LA3]MDN4586002.1 anti-sigma factor [Pandoraea capi]
MRVNADFSRRIVVTPSQYTWVPSPQAGVERVMLDRIGAEQARATSLVRYAPNSTFPAHHHPGGEEIFVLSGTFSADGQDYPPGGYLRNPPGSAHRPSSRDGATIFVKLRQMSATQDQPISLDTREASHWKPVAGGEVCMLFVDAQEHVELRRLHANETTRCGDTSHIVEVLVTEGALLLDGATLPAGSWIRLPAGDAINLTAGSDGVCVYRKVYMPPVQS